jgi:hypothetical protein
MIEGIVLLQVNLPEPHKKITVQNIVRKNQSARCGIFLTLRCLEVLKLTHWFKSEMDV